MHEYGADPGIAASKELTNRDGFVYVITNKAWPHAVKIGRAFDPDSRLAGYQTSSPYRDYELQYAVYFEDCYEAERTIHRRLDADRLDGEWFQFPIEDAIDAIDQLREQRPCGQR